jgi:Na+-translocating ferredoxin:NAD+ oxidoreductase RNF subunit RnfB
MSAISRRDLFRSLFRRNKETPDDLSPAELPAPFHAPADDVPQLALILDRFCLAWQGSFCSVCAERCPVPGAIVTRMGKPSVVPDLCTGCRICHDVCPAPKNAVFLVARTPRPGMIGRTVAETTPAEQIPT